MRTLLAALGLFLAMPVALAEQGPADGVFQALPKAGPKKTPDLPDGIGAFSVLSHLRELHGANGNGDNGNGGNGHEEIQTTNGPAQAIAVLNDPKVRAEMPAFLRWIIDQCGASFPGWSHHPQQRKRGFNEKHYGGGLHCFIVEDFMGFRLFVEGLTFPNSVRGDTETITAGGMYDLIRLGDFGLHLGVGVTHVRYEIPRRRMTKEGTVPLFSAAIDYKKKVQIVWVPIPNITGDRKNGRFFIVHFFYVRAPVKVLE